MSNNPHAERLLRRYPALAAVAPENRAAVVRKAMTHPVVFVLLIALGAFAIPVYANRMMELMQVEVEPNILIKIAKIVVITVIPTVFITMLLTRLVMPPLIKRIAAKLTRDSAATQNATDTKSEEQKDTPPQQGEQ